MASGMLADKRKAAGLDSNFFYTNAVESMHFRYKNLIRRTKDDYCK